MLLLGSHIEKVEQLFYVDNPIEALKVDDHFTNCNARTHLLSSPATNPQMGQSLSPLTLIGIHQAINHQGQNRMNPNAEPVFCGYFNNRYPNNRYPCLSSRKP